MKEILTDVDGVLLNWVDAFHSWMSQFDFDCQDSIDYQLTNSYPNTDPVAVIEKINIFSASARMGFLDPYDDAVEYVSKLHSQGYYFHCISSMGGDDYSRMLREANLIALFGSAIASVTIVDCGQSKRKALEKYRGSGLIWLEDHIGNANVGAEYSLKTFLFNHKYNQNNPTGKAEEFIRVNNWKDLYDHINS